jgi:hypothetical protein
MGHRIVKRVSLDFFWPINETWKGYFNPHPCPDSNCPSCEGTGLTPRARQLEKDFYDLDGFGLRWSYNYGFDPNGRPANRPPWQILGDCYKWSDKITQDEVLALVKASRLYDFTHTWSNEDGWKLKIWETKGFFCKQCYEGVPQLSPEHLSCHCTKCDKEMILLEGNDLRLLMPFAEEVNEWEKKGGLHCHDGINRSILIKTRAKRLGIWGLCRYPKCRGNGYIPYKDKRIRRKSRKWKAYEPPTGQGWQLWETCSEGSPQTPVFVTAEKLAEYCEDNATISSDEKLTKEQWLKLIKEDNVESASMMISSSDGHVGSAASILESGDIAVVNKLTPKGFEIAANTHLDGTNMLDLLTGVKLDVDDNGYIKKHIFLNLKKSLRVAIKMSPNDVVKTKCKNLLDFMETY